MVMIIMMTKLVIINSRRFWSSWSVYNRRKVRRGNGSWLKTSLWRWRLSPDFYHNRIGKVHNWFKWHNKRNRNHLVVQLYNPHRKANRVGLLLICDFFSGGGGDHWPTVSRAERGSGHQETSCWSWIGEHGQSHEHDNHSHEHDHGHEHDQSHEHDEAISLVLRFWVDHTYFTLLDLLIPKLYWAVTFAIFIWIKLKPGRASCKHTSLLGELSSSYLTT